MADSKLTALSAITTLDGDEVVYVVDDPGGTPASKKITTANVKAYISDYRNFTAVTANNSGITAAINTLYTVTLNDQTITLPAASSHTNKTIGFKVVGVSGSKICTLDGNSSETIDGAATLVLYVLNDFVEIVSDGTNWQIVSKQFSPHQTRLRRDAAQTINSASLTKIAFDAEEYDVGGIGDVATNDRVDIRRAGKYQITASGNFAGGSGLVTTQVAAVYINGTRTRDGALTLNFLNANSNYQIIPAVLTVELAATDTVEMYMYHDASGGNTRDTVTTTYGRPSLEVLEVL